MRAIAELNKMERVYGDSRTAVTTAPAATPVAFREIEVVQG